MLGLDKREPKVDGSGIGVGEGDSLSLSSNICGGCAEGGGHHPLCGSKG